MIFAKISRHKITEIKVPVKILKLVIQMIYKSIKSPMSKKLIIRELQ